jgi:hypothetical protein
MAISFVGSASAEATSVALPTHQAGDFLLLVLLRMGVGVIPTPVLGWATAGNVAYVGNSNNVSAFYKIAQSSSEVSGSWNNANLILAAVYRDAGKAMFAPFRNANRNSGNNIINYPQKAEYSVASATPGSDRMASAASCVLGISSTSSNSVSLAAPPNGMTHRQQALGASAGQIVLHDTAGDVARWSSTNITVSSAIEYASMVIDLVSLDFPGGTAGFTGIRGMSRRLGA